MQLLTKMNSFMDSFMNGLTARFMDSFMDSFMNNSTDKFREASWRAS